MCRAFIFLIGTGEKKKRRRRKRRGEEEEGIITINEKK